MTAATPRTSAFDCLVRGVHSLRANWQLVPLVWLQQVLMLVLLFASVVGFLVPFGFGALPLDRLEGMTAAELEGLVVELMAAPGALLVPLLVALLVSTLLGLLAILVYGWFQGGVMAVLLAGERQALPGEPRDWRLFRTFEWRNFAGWGGRLMWRYFWFFHLYLTLFLGLLLVAALVVVLAAWGQQAWGGAAAWGIGCGGALPVFFALVVMVFWYLLAQADLAREDGGVGISSRRALEVLGRRPGAVVLLAAAFLAASLLLSLGTAPFSMLTAGLVEQSLFAYCFGQVLVYGVQSAIGSFLNVAFLGGLVAVVHSTRPEDRGGPSGDGR